MRFQACVTAGCLFIVSVASPQTGKHAFTADDWAALHSAAAVAVAPNGTTILWKASWGGEKGPTNEEWRLIATDGTNARKLIAADNLRFGLGAAAIFQQY